MRAGVGGSRRPPRRRRCCPGVNGCPRCYSSVFSVSANAVPASRKSTNCETNPGACVPSSHYLPTILDSAHHPAHVFGLLFTRVNAPALPVPCLFSGSGPGPRVRVAPTLRGTRYPARCFALFSTAPAFGSLRLGEFRNIPQVSLVGASSPVVERWREFEGTPHEGYGPSAALGHAPPRPRSHLDGT